MQHDIHSSKKFRYDVLNSRGYKIFSLHSDTRWDDKMIADLVENTDDGRYCREVKLYDFGKPNV